MSCRSTKSLWTNAAFFFMIAFPVDGWLNDFFMSTRIGVLCPFSFIFYQVPGTCMWVHALVSWSTDTPWTCTSESGTLRYSLLVDCHCCLHRPRTTKQWLLCCHHMDTQLTWVWHTFWVCPLRLLNNFPLRVQVKISIESFIETCVALSLYCLLNPLAFSMFY